MLQRLRGEKGFGLLELLMAMTMLNIGILAIVAAFTSGTVAIRRASRLSTAAALADAQMELYRALKYDSIILNTASVTSANADTKYSGDSAWATTQVTAPCSGVPNECNPLRTATGADRLSYRVDTYVVYDTPTNGRQLKKVTVVVRDASSLSSTFAREASTFDQSTGS